MFYKKKCSPEGQIDRAKLKAPFTFDAGSGLARITKKLNAND
jgi:hypothetical protein